MPLSPAVQQSLLPTQARPVRRPELVEPHTTIDLVHGKPDQIVDALLDLLLGANFNDPQCWMPPGYARMKVSA